MPVVTRATRAQAQARRLEVSRLTLAGASLRAIASQLGISHETARQDRIKIFQETAREQATGLAEYRTMINEQYNRQLLNWWPKSLDRIREDGTQQAGDQKAHENVMGILASIRRMNGVDEITA